MDRVSGAKEQRWWLEMLELVLFSTVLRRTFLGVLPCVTSLLAVCSVAVCSLVSLSEVNLLPFGYDSVYDIRL